MCKHFKLFAQTCNGSNSGAVRLLQKKLENQIIDLFACYMINKLPLRHLSDNLDGPTSPLEKALQFTKTVLLISSQLNLESPPI